VVLAQRPAPRPRARRAAELNNVTLPAQGSGSSSPVVETLDTTGSDGPQRQVVALKGALLVPVAGLAYEVTSGGMAVTVAEGPLNGGFVANPASAAAQGLGYAENAYLDLVGVPGGTDAAANGHHEAPRAW
jgi:hypothetical protein